MSDSWNWKTYTFQGDTYCYNSMINTLYTYDKTNQTWVIAELPSDYPDVAKNTKDIARLESRADLQELELIKLRKFNNDVSMRVRAIEGKNFEASTRKYNFKTNILSAAVLILSFTSLYTHGFFKMAANALGF